MAVGEEKIVCSFDSFGFDVLSDARDDILSSVQGLRG
jgi:hypothetical protein